MCVAFQSARYGPAIVGTATSVTTIRAESATRAAGAVAAGACSLGVLECAAMVLLGAGPRGRARVPPYSRSAWERDRARGRAGVRACGRAGVWAHAASRAAQKLRRDGARRLGGRCGVW